MTDEKLFDKLDELKSNIESSEKRKLAKRTVATALAVAMLLYSMPLSVSADEVYSSAYASPYNASFNFLYYTQGQNSRAERVKLKNKIYTATTITLNWKGGEHCHAYNVYVYNPKTQKYEFGYQTRQTYMHLSNLKKNTTYKFKIAAIDSFMCEGEMTGVITVKTLSSDSELISKPSGIKQTPSTTSVKLSWKPVEGAVSYRIYVYKCLDKLDVVYDYVEELSTKKTSAVIDGLVKGGNTYKFKIVAVDKNGNEGKRTGVIKVTTLDKELYTGKTAKTPQSLNRKYCKFGMKKETVLKNCGASDVYIDDDHDNTYIGSCIMGDRNATVAFRFNSKDELYSYSIYATCLYTRYQYEIVPDFKRNYPDYTEPLRSISNEEPQLLYKAYINSTQSVSLAYDILSVGISYTYEDSAYDESAAFSSSFFDF